MAPLRGSNPAAQEGQRNWLTSGFIIWQEKVYWMGVKARAIFINRLTAYPTKSSQSGSSTTTLHGPLPSHWIPQHPKTIWSSHQLLLGLIHHFPKKKKHVSIKTAHKLRIIHGNSPILPNPKSFTDRPQKCPMPLRDTGVGCPSSCTGRAGIPPW